MDFDLNEDQRAFADTARAILVDYCGDEQLRQFGVSGAPFQQDLWQQCCAAGLHSMIVPEAEGGLGLGMTELMAVLQEQGAALGAVPLWEHQLAAAAIALHGTSGLRRMILEPALEKKGLLALSLASSCAPQGATLRARPHGEGWQVTGRVAAVPFAAQADWALLAAELQGESRLLLVALDSPGVRRVPGMSQHGVAIADLEFDQVVANADSWLTRAAFSWIEPRVIACLAALQVGVSIQQLARTVEYAGMRKQFERPIGTFQLVAGQMADGKIALEVLRTSLLQLVYLLDSGARALPQAWATRYLACEAGHKIGHMAQHVHGGLGVDTSHAIHRFLFWSRALGVALGGTERNLAKLGDWLADHDSLGWKYELAEDEAV